MNLPVHLLIKLKIPWRTSKEVTSFFLYMFFRKWHCWKIKSFDLISHSSVGVQHGRTRSLVESWEKIRANPSPLIQIPEFPPSESNAMLPTMVFNLCSLHIFYFLVEIEQINWFVILIQGGTDLVSNTESRSYDDGSSDALLQNHDSLINTLKSRLMKLQVSGYLFWLTVLSNCVNAF